MRPAVRWWAELMEEELKKNEYKKGWLDGRYVYYLERARANLREISLLSGDDFIIKSLADCSNFCMMVADNLRDFNDRLGKKKDKKSG